MTEQEAINKLDGLKGADPEYDHVYADEILLEFLESSGHHGIVKAWKRASDRADFWYA